MCRVKKYTNTKCFKDPTYAIIWKAVVSCPALGNWLHPRLILWSDRMSSVTGKSMYNQTRWQHPPIQFLTTLLQCPTSILSTPALQQLKVWWVSYIWCLSGYQVAFNGIWLWVSGNLLGIGDGFPNTSLVLMEHEYNLDFHWSSGSISYDTTVVQDGMHIPKVGQDGSTHCAILATDFRFQYFF